MAERRHKPYNVTRNGVLAVSLNSFQRESSHPTDFLQSWLEWPRDWGMPRSFQFFHLIPGFAALAGDADTPP
jgi:hypothetical protein